MKKLLLTTAAVIVLSTTGANAALYGSLGGYRCATTAAAGGAGKGVSFLTAVGNGAAYGGVLTLVALSPYIIQQTNPLCELFTCYDDKGQPFVNTNGSIHPQ